MTDMIVSGAGTSAVNGTYEEGNYINGKPSYNKAQDYILYWRRDADLEEYVWGIFTSSGISSLYYSLDDVASPDLCSSWAVLNGVSPAPTVTKEGEEPTGIPKQFLHYARMRGN